MKNLLRTVLLMCFLPVSVAGFAQESISLDIPRVVPVSPEATAMEKYQYYPVDHSTGIPSINIPLYEIVSGEVTIPVSLSYHASGLKPKEKSGMAGTGWTLNLEPSVSRQVNGAPDESYYGWFYKNRFWLPLDEAGELDYYDKLTSNVYDTSPDKFTYKLPHGGGAGYFINGTSPLITLPHTNDKVLFRGGTMNITDENGIKYNFDGTYETLYGTYGSYGDIITRWMCNSIYSSRELPDALVSFSYNPPRRETSPNAFYNLNNTENIVRTDYKLYVQNGWNCSRIEPGAFLGNNIYEAALTGASNDEIGRIFPKSDYFQPGDISTVTLSEVRFAGNKLSVDYKGVGTSTTYSEVLNEMLVTDQNGALIRKIKFYITPYNSNTILTKLDSVVISAPGVEPRTYSFKYNNSFGVPSHYTTAVDHWGFYTGRGGENSHTVIDFEIYLDTDNLLGANKTMRYRNNGANREPSHQYTETGILQQITSPQGIQTSFFYEGNFGAFRNNDYEEKDYLHPVGGLRIGRIETLEPQTRKKITKSYKYGLTKVRRGSFDMPWDGSYEPIWGGGAIKHIVTQNDYVSGITRDTGQVPWEHWSAVYGIRTYRSMPMTNIRFHGGSAVLYNIVSETTYSNSGSDWLRTDYYYDVPTHQFEDVLQWDPSDPPGSFRKYDWDNQSLYKRLPNHPAEPSDDFHFDGFYTCPVNGLLKRVEHFRQKEMVSCTEYLYPREFTQACAIRIEVPVKLIIMSHEYCLSMGKSQDMFATYNNSSDHGYTIQYYLDTNNFRPVVRETTKDFYRLNGRLDSIVTVKKYTYSAFLPDPSSSLKPRKIEMTNSNGTMFTDDFDYLTNYPGILSYHKHTEGGSVKESRIQFLSGTCLPEKIQSKTGGLADFRDEVVYSAYDIYKNPIELMGKDGSPVFFVWGYRHRFPIAKIVNITRQELYEALCPGLSEGSVQGELGDWAKMLEPASHVWEKIDSLRTKLPTAQVTAYKYNPQHGVVTITDPNNVTSKFDYDGYSRLTDSYYLDMDSRKVMLQKYIYNLGK